MEQFKFFLCLAWKQCPSEVQITLVISVPTWWITPKLEIALFLWGKCFRFPQFKGFTRLCLLSDHSYKSTWMWWAWSHVCWHPWLWWKINDVKWGEVTNSDQRFSCLKISGLLSKENRFEPCSGVRFDSGFASASSSKLRMQQLAFKLKPLLVPRVILVEANCSSIRCVLGLTLWCFFPQSNIRKCGREVWSFPEEARCLCLGFPTKVNAFFFFLIFLGFLTF